MPAASKSVACQYCAMEEFTINVMSNGAVMVMCINCQRANVLCYLGGVEQ